MSRLVTAASQPFVKIVASATLRVKSMDGPLKEHIDVHNASGADLTASVWKEYVSWQRKLVSYRYAKLQEELHEVTSGKAFSFGNMSYKEYIIGLRVITKCIAIFLMFTMLGRGTVFPLLEPTSPFLKQVDLLQPNHRRYLNVNL
jgi:hypothetical protein